MSARASTRVTQILRAPETWDRGSSEELLPLVYDELRRLARSYMAREPAGHTLQPTALVHEAYLRLVGEQHLEWQGRAHFFAAAARAMRRILVDRARRRKTSKHGGDRARIPVERIQIAEGEDPPELVLALNDALEKLERIDARKAQIVMLRYFVDMTIEETASLLNLSPTTVKNEWRFSKAWLWREMSSNAGCADNPEVGSQRSEVRGQ